MICIIAISSCLVVTSVAGPDAAAKEPAKKETKKDRDTPTGEVDVQKTTERIVNDATEAGKRLAEKDAGDATQRLQDQIVKNIDALICKAKEPPPMSNDATPSQSGDAPKQPSESKSDAKSSQSTTRKERRERSKAQANGKQGMQQTPTPTRSEAKAGLGQLSESLNKIESKNIPPRIPENYKDVWGHLPEKMRKDMDLYFREQFMPRYNELLKQYYSSLSERGGKTGGTP